MSFKATVATPPQMKPNRPQPTGPERDAPAPQQRPKPRKPGQVPLAVKIIVSLLVDLARAAVFLAPLSIQPARRWWSRSPSGRPCSGISTRSTSTTATISSPPSRATAT